jgi:hypothetical protein
VLSGIDFSARAAKAAGDAVGSAAVGCFGKPEGGLFSARTESTCKQKGIGYFPGIDDALEFRQDRGKIVWMNGHGISGVPG